MEEMEILFIFADIKYLLPIMEQDYMKDPEELYQEELKEEQELLGYCKKIKQGIENLDENSGERAIWELTQNARDVAENDNCIIKIILKDDKFVFSHRGMPFEYRSLLALVNQNSSKDNPNADLAGQYGTGFMTTHAFCNIVSIDAPYKVMVSKDVLKGYVLLENFTLNRSFVDNVNEDMSAAKNEMREEIKAVNKAYKREPLYPSLESLNEEKRWTRFTYNLNGRHQVASEQLARAIRLMPLVLLINKRIKEVEIIDDYAHLHQKVTKITGASVKKLDNIEGWQLSSYQIFIDDQPKPIGINCLESEDSKDKIILPPYPISCGCVEDIPSLFLWFPLLGTEKFGVNFIFHSKRFYPVEKRNSILLPVDVPSKIEKGKRNETVLKEMMNALLKYYANEDNAASLDISMCQVNFNQKADDLVTRQFYIDLQTLWKEAIQNWKVIPTVDGKKAITDPKVKVLHPDFYSELNNDERKEYEPLLKAFASKVMYDENNAYLLPSENLIEWSETINKWDCGKDNEFYITVEDVCKTIKENSNDLMTFLEFLKVSGNLSLVSQHALIPNREGELKKKGDLRHGDFMTSEVYNLVKVVMGDDASRMIKTECLKIIEEVPEYTPKNLHDAITSTMQRWRSMYMNPNMPNALGDDQLTSLINFCSATSQTDFSNIRGRLMSCIPALFDKEFKQRYLAKLEDKEDDFYSAAFNLLRDYSLMTLSLKDKEWVTQNKQWVIGFLKEYAVIKDKEFVDKLDIYGVIPNWHDVLCIKKDLLKNEGVPEEFVKYYKAIFNKDLYDGWICKELASYFELSAQTPKDVASKIQEALENDMSEKGEKHFTKVLREIILILGERTEWKEWFGHIEEKKATYTFNMKSGDAQKSLFALMDLDDNELKDLANISEKGKMAELIDKIQKQIRQEQVTAARFSHLQTIGEHVEEALLKALDNDVVQVVYPKDKNEYVDAINRQNGQDIVVMVKVNGYWKEVFYIEVKSKWDFDDPAHMSTNQIKKACLHPKEYALCCVDLRPFKNSNLVELPVQVIVNATRVKMNIGDILAPMVSSILDADKLPDKTQIKISEYRTNMSAEVFEQGLPFKVLTDTIYNIVRKELYGLESYDLL